MEIVLLILVVASSAVSVIALLKVKQVKKAIFEIIAPDLELQKNEIIKIKKKL